MTRNIDAYPTEAELLELKEWPIEQSATLIPRLAELWIAPYGSAEETRPGLWTFATGGWSGNEELYYAAKQSMAWHILFWDALYVPGGLIVVAITEQAKTLMQAKQSEITDWAWNR